MADKTEFLQAIDDAILDADSLERFINGSDSETVLTRLSAQYPTLQKAIKELFENGGLPATPFKTKALMTASALVDGDYAQVTDDTVNNGLYVKTAGAWVKSGYDPVGLTEKKIDDMYKSIHGIDTTPWELGTFTGSGGGIYPATNRARKVGGFLLAPNMKVQISSNNPNMQVRIVLRNEEGHAYYVSDYVSASEAIIPFEYNLVVRNADDSLVDLSLVESDISVKFVPAAAVLKETINDLFRTVNSEIETSWVYGTVARSGEISHVVNDNRLRTVPFKMPYEGLLKITIDDPSLRYILNTYDINGNAINPSLEWSEEEEKELQVNGYFSIVLAKKDDSVINLSDADISIHTPPVGIAKRVDQLEEKLTSLIMTGGYEYVTGWESGTYHRSTGNYFSSNTRLRPVSGKVAFTGLLSVTTLNPDQLVSVVTFDNSGEFKGLGEYSTNHDVPIDGYFGLIVRWADERVIHPDDANISIKLSQNTPSSSGDLVAQKIDIPQFSSVPYGHLLDKTLPELQTAFDTEVSKYVGTTKKESIGMSTDGLHEMFAYTLTPDNYTTTIAITMHVHGDERYNPLGFFALLGEMAKEGAKHPQIKWLRDNVKWYVVPFSSPMSVAANTRNTDGVNLNRNFDFMWETGDLKGESPYSLNESRNIANFFKPKKHEIDFHLDLHDIPRVHFEGVSHKPANASSILFRAEQNAMRDYLASINGAIDGGTYIVNGGSASNWFMGVLGVPAITLEHVTQHWLRKGLSADQRIAKALEQTCGYVYMFMNLKSSSTYAKGSAYYTRDHETSFCSQEFGNHLWTSEDIKTAFEEVSFLSKTTGDFEVFTNASKPDAKTILVLSGTTADGNDTDLTALRVMQRIDSGEHMYLDHLKNSNLVVAPTLNGSGASESVIRNRIQLLIAEHTPDYTLLLETAGVTVAGGATVARSSSDSNFTDMTLQSDVMKSNEIKGYDAEITGRYTSLFLGSDMTYYSSYAHNAAKWVGLAANDLASYFANSQ